MRTETKIDPTNLRTMSPLKTTLRAALGGVILLGATYSAALAQSGDAKQPQAQNQQGAPNDPARDEKRRMDEFAEAARTLGGPAANPECVWLGRRVVSLMWRDDLDTAFRHLDMYDRFGCPAGHIQATFRCVVRQGSFDPKNNDTMQSRIHACWVNPSMQPATAAAPAPAPAAPQARAPETAPTKQQ